MLKIHIKKALLVMKATRTSSLLMTHLPIEILSNIFSYIDAEPLYLYCFSALPSVCKSFRRILEWSIQYKHPSEEESLSEVELCFSTNVKSHFQHNLSMDWLDVATFQRTIQSKRLEYILERVSAISCMDLSNQRNMFQGLLKKNEINEVLKLIELIYMKGVTIKRIYLCGCFTIAESKEMQIFVRSLIGIHQKYQKPSDTFYIDVSPTYIPNEYFNEATEYLNYNMIVTDLHNEFEETGIQVVDWFDLLFNPIESDAEFLERIKFVDPVNIPHVNIKGWTLLHSSVLNGYFRSTQYLLTLPQVNVNICSIASFSNDDSSLRVPSNGDDELDDNSPLPRKTVPSLEFKLKYKGTPLFFSMYRYAIADKHTKAKEHEVMDMLIHRGASVHVTDNYNRTFLLIAISYNFPSPFIEYLVTILGDQFNRSDCNFNNVFHQMFYSPAFIKNTENAKKLMDLFFQKGAHLSVQTNSNNLLPVQVSFVYSNMKNILSKECFNELAIVIDYLIALVRRHLGADKAEVCIDLAIDDCLRIINDTKFSKKKMLTIVNKIFSNLLRIKVDNSVKINKADINEVRQLFMRLDELTGLNILHKMKRLECVKTFFKFLDLGQISYYFISILQIEMEVQFCITLLSKVKVKQVLEMKLTELLKNSKQMLDTETRLEKVL